MISPLLFVTCFMFVVSLLLLGVLYSRIPWTVKAGLVVASLGFSLLFYYGYVDSLGFPTQVRPPALFRFIYGVVREPMQVNNDAGAIYIWIIVDGWQQPRAIAMPYSTENRKAIAAAKKQVAAGKTVYMGVGKGDNGEKTDKGDSTNGTQNKSSSGSNLMPYELHGQETLLFEKPPDTVPKKESQND
jgi:hypothetical protein